MPELPEITVLARQMKTELVGKTFTLIFDFEDGTCLIVNFWWFGYAH